jgi:CheY-like chemotaxis protein
LADPGQIQQVLLNLAINARDAMPGGGTLSIAVDEADAAPEAMGEALPPGPYVRLSVTDTGIGMDEATRVRIFEPFFTTKEVGKGTGLGLATVHGIVHQSGGFITVESEVGKGTTFRIYFPRIPATETPGAVEPKSSASPRGTERVLVVEDAEDVRLLVSRVLRDRGYVVLEAARGEDAVALVEGCGPPIDLLITDQIMPGMSGHALAERLLTLQPGLRVLFMSGYAETGSTAVDGVVRHFLAKPFRPDELARKVREVLQT